MSEAETPPALTEEEAVGLLAAYIVARDKESGAGKHREHLGKLLKSHLEAHPGEVLWDGERKIEARLQGRSGGVVYDLLSLKANDDVLFWRLVDLGCLVIDPGAVKAQATQLGGIERYAMPGKGSTALIVEVKR